MSAAGFDMFLRRVFEATGIASQNELASVLNIHRAAVSQAKRKGAVPERWILILSRKFGLNPEWLETGEGLTFSSQEAGAAFVHVPKVAARLSAGGGSFETASKIEGHFAFQRSWLTQKGDPGRMVLMDVSGDSMEPEIRDGDMVLIDRSRVEMLAGAIYAVGVDEAILVKRVEKQPNALVLHSDNPRYAPMVLRGDETAGVRMIGRVIWVCREYR
jgi:phage repressor protein C with HTH and peptisase S24 domain